MSNFMYKSIGTLLGLSTFTLAPFLAFIWVGFTPPAIIIFPLLAFAFYSLGQNIYELSPEAESSYSETLGAFGITFVVIVVLASIGFSVYDWVA